MNFYNDPQKVAEYIKMCKDYDGSNSVTALKKHLRKNATILELGSGPGIDIKLLKDVYKITGSDLSDLFLRINHENFPQIEFLKLDAVSIETTTKYDCVYSNKVLHHLTTQTLHRSFERQKHVINQKGLFAHTFWVGKKKFTHEGMYFNFHDKDKLIDMISGYFKIAEIIDYKEFEENDSVFVLATN